VDFMAALLTSETGNTAKVVKYINECREMNITVLSPDVNHSDWSFTPDGDAIRFGLGAVKNLGQSAVEAVARARQEGGGFRSLYDFCERVDLGSLNRRMIESLIRAGAMDSLEGERARKFAAVESAMEGGQRASRDRESGQAGLFGELMTAEEHHTAPLPNVPDWTDKEKLAGEKELLGFWVTGHPLDRYADKVSELATHDSSSLDGLVKGAEIILCGVPTGVTRKRNKEGKPWATMTIEDRGGSVEALVFASSYERLAPQIVEDEAVLVRGLALPEEGGATKISVQDIVPLDNARVDMPSVISIRVWLGRDNGADRARALGEIFQRKPGDTQVRLRLEMPRDFAVLLDVPSKVRPDKEFKALVAQLCGPECIERLAG
jgi:DNA polymerase-3 subunit alpha